LSLPRAGSVKAKVLSALLAGRRITGLDCWTEFGSSRLSHHVLKLRSTGWPIQSEPITVQTSDHRTAHIARYSIDVQRIIDGGSARDQELFAAVVAARGAR
jgi:hypothetical protein